MSRWKVAQHIQYRFWLAYPAVYDSEQPESDVDDDLPRQPLARGFRKWQDALDYADRMARTREVVLPRLAPQGEVTVSAQWYCDQGVIHYINAAGDVTQGTPADLARHAATLLALAEQENV